MPTVTRHQRTETPEESWYQSAARDERIRLFTGPSVAAFCLAMGLALWLALPGASLADRLAQSTRSDPLTVAYLRAWLAAKPDDLPLLHTLARKYLAAGDWNRAMAALAAPLADGTPALRRRAQWTRLEILEARAYAAAEGSETRADGLVAVRAQLRLLVGSDGGLALEPAELDLLAARARALGDTTLTLALVRTQAQFAPPGGRPQSEWLGQLSSTAESLGDPALAADLHWRSFDAAATETERRTHFFAAIRLMQAADRTAAALGLADARLGRLQTDTGLMRFMVRLALSAGRPDLADRYAREMLRFALQEQWRNLAHAGDAAFVRVTADPTGRGQRPRLPFDEAVYQLAFDAFLANRNLDDAYEVAAAAVRHAPDAVAWRRRLAQVAQWSGRPQIALEQWLAIARAESRADDWARVELMAAQLAEGEILLEALRFRTLLGDDEALDARIARMIEDRGEPRAAIDWLTARIDARGERRSALLIERQIALHEALGDDVGLAAWLDRADGALGPDPKRAMRRAGLRIQRGDSVGAFAALQAASAAARSAPPPTADGEVGFWTLYAQLATRLQRDDDADDAYRHLLMTGDDGQSVLSDWSTILQARSPRAAAHVATYAWQRGGRPADAQRAFALWLEAGDFGALERLGRTMPAAQLAALTGQRGYLQALSTHLQAQGDEPGARRALEQALALAPEDPELRAGLLWLLLAQRQAGPLRAALLRWDRAAERDAPMWGPYAASWMALDEPQRALRWFVRQARTGQADDYLWQLGYADCLEQNGLVDTAWSVRRRAWLELRRLPAAERRAQPWREQATLALAMRYANADAARDALRRLVADRDAVMGTRAPLPTRGQAAAGVAGPPQASAGLPAAPGPASPRALLARVDAELATLVDRTAAADDDEGGPDARRIEARSLAAGSRELALSWLLSHDASDAASAWLLSRYASQLARPAWARLSVALASNDREALTGLLDELPDWLPRMEQVDAMRATGREAQAQTLAWTLAAERPTVEDAHRRFVDLALPDASFALLEAGGADIGVLGLRSQRLQLRQTIRPGIAVGLVADRDRQRSLDPSQLTGVPSDAGRIGATLSWRSEALLAETTVSRFFAVRDRSGIRVDLRPRPDGDRGLSGSLALRQVAPESAPLRIGGMKDLLELRWAQPITARDRIAATVTGVRLDSQDGSALGSGTLWMLDATHRLRLDYPDLALKALVIRSDWRVRPVADTIVAPLVPAALGDPTAAVIPASSTEVAAGVAFGESVAQAYSRGLRPFGEVLIRSNTVSGAGYSVRGGATMSVLGTDRLTAFLTLLSRTPGIPRSTRAFGLAYQYLF